MDGRRYFRELGRKVARMGEAGIEEGGDFSRAKVVLVVSYDTPDGAGGLVCHTTAYDEASQATLRAMANLLLSTAVE
jgi:hypothetical protein